MIYGHIAINRPTSPYNWAIETCNIDDNPVKILEVH